MKYRSRSSWLPALCLALACTSESNPPSPDGGGAGAGGANTGGASPPGRGGALGSGGAAAPGQGGGTSTGGASSGGRASTGGIATSTGGSLTSAGGTSGGAGGALATGGAAASGGTAGSSSCDRPDLAWKTARKTNYTSYPDPGSAECVEYNGCTWAGQFAACNGKKPESWVEAHSIAAAFPDFDTLELHDLCLRSGSKTLVVTVLDTCGDSDCSGCCTRNKGNADQLIDLESYTNSRWGVPDGPIEWADLGPTKTSGCD